MKSIYIFFLCLVVLGCNSDAPRESENPTDDAISRIENGLKPTLRIAGRDYSGKSIGERMKNFNVPGVSIAFFEDNEIKWTRTYGFIDSDSTAPVDENTRFQAASISKPVAASAMMKLVEEGVLDLDTDVNDYLKDIKIEAFMPESADTTAAVTLRKLVTHTAGLTVHGFGGYADGDSVPSTLQVLRGESPANSDAVILDTIPGSIWRYSGGGYTLMQYIIEENINPDFPEFMQETVLTPVGMTHSTYEQPLPVELRTNTSIGHRPDGSQVAGKWHTYPEKAAAGLWTTPSDLARWAMTIQRAYNGSEAEFISPETAGMILTKHLGDWGLGPGLQGENDSLVFRHGGANEGYRCNLLAFATGKRQGAVIMTNGDLGGPLMSEIMIAFDQEYGWNIFKPQIRSSIRMEPEVLSDYTGTYGDQDLEIILFLQGDELMARIGENNFTLYPEAKDRFFDSQDAQTVSFLRDEDSTIIGFEVNQRKFMKTD